MLPWLIKKLMSSPRAKAQSDGEAFSEVVAQDATTTGNMHAAELPCLIVDPVDPEVEGGVLFYARCSTTKILVRILAFCNVFRILEF